MMLVNHFLGTNTASDSSDSDDSVTRYSLSESNSIRIGSPFPEHFGRFICYPDLAQTSYTEYVDQEQYLYFLGIIGVGEYEIEGVYIDETPIGDYSEASYNILPPGTAPSLVPRLVWVSEEVSGQELTTDWLTYVVNPAGTIVWEIGFDVVFPSGLCGFNSKGKRYDWLVRVILQARDIDEDGNPTTDWNTIYIYEYWGATRDALRYSVRCLAGGSRYEVRIRRDNPAQTEQQLNDTGFSVLETATISALRGYGVTHPAYGDVTMIEARIKATEQLNGSSASKLNVIATRKLYPVGSTGFGASREATRSISDAIAYIVTSDNGGQQDFSIIDWETLAELKTTWASRGDLFDYRFTSRTSVMEACDTAALCGRAVTYMPGGMVSLARDEYQESPAQIYNESDITEGSLEITHTLRTADSPTCVEVQYVDPGSWETKSIYCYDANGSETTPCTVTLNGCTSRSQAWREGMYSYKDDELNRTSVTFTTGLKGHIPHIGQLVLVAMSSVDWGQSGIAAAIDGVNVWLSEPVDFGSATVAQMIFSSSAGGVIGPVSVTPGDATHCVVVDLSAEDVRTLQEDGEQATKFLFGLTVSEMLPVRVIKIQPQSENEVRISGSIVHEEVYEADGGTIPDEDSLLSGFSLIEGASLNYQGYSDGAYQYYVSWYGSATTFRVQLDEGSGYATLADNLSAYGYSFTTMALEVDVKIIPYDDGALSEDGAVTVTKSFPAAPTGLAVSGDVGETVTITWNAVTGADRYQVAVYVDDESVVSESVTSPTASITTEEMAVLGGPWSEFTVYVWAIDGTDQSQPATLVVTATAPAAVTGLALQARLTNGVTLSWSEASGATGYRVYHGTEDNFDPATEGTLVYSGTATSATIGGLDMTGNYAHYFRVAGVNSYFTAPADLNFSDVLLVAPETEYKTLVNDAGENLLTNDLEQLYVEA
jgi:hypothetical protein